MGVEYGGAPTEEIEKVTLVGSMKVGRDNF